MPNHNHVFYNGFGNYVNPTVDRSHSTTWGASFSDSGDYKVAPADKQTMDGPTGQPHNNLQPYFTCYIFKRTS